MEQADSSESPAPLSETAPAAKSNVAWLATGGFVLGVGSFVLWAIFGLPAPLVAGIGFTLGYVAVRRAKSGRSKSVARWALRLSAAHLLGWVAFIGLMLIFGVFAISSLGV